MILSWRSNGYLGLFTELSLGFLVGMPKIAMGTRWLGWCGGTTTWEPPFSENRKRFKAGNQTLSTARVDVETLQNDVLGWRNVEWWLTGTYISKIVVTIQTFIWNEDHSIITVLFEMVILLKFFYRDHGRLHCLEPPCYSPCEGLDLHPVCGSNMMLLGNTDVLGVLLEYLHLYYYVLLVLLLLLLLLLLFVLLLLLLLLFLLLVKYQSFHMLDDYTYELNVNPHCFPYPTLDVRTIRRCGVSPALTWDYSRGVKEPNHTISYLIYPLVN